MAAEESIRSFVKRLLSSGSLYVPKHSPKRRDEGRCTCGEQPQIGPVKSCPEHPSRGRFRNLGGPEYSRLSPDALKELETDVEKGIGRNCSPKNVRVLSKSATVPAIVKPSPVKSISKDMDIARRVSPGFSRGIIPLTSLGAEGASHAVALPKIKTSVASSPSVRSPTPHYSHFKRRDGPPKRGRGVVYASGRVAEVERDSLSMDKETLERLAASKQAGFSGRGDALEAGTDFISVTTFNILAPIYKRVSGEGLRESADEARWKKRNEEIVELLLAKGSSIICLQVGFPNDSSSFLRRVEKTFLKKTHTSRQAGGVSWLHF